LVFTPKMSEAPSQSYRGLHSSISEDSQVPDLKSSWFSRGILESLRSKSQKKAAHRVNPQTIVKRIFSHRAEIPEEVKSLSQNPRQPGPFAIEDIAWPLELLSLPYVPSHEELGSLIPAIDEVIAASGKSEAEITRARERVKQAYDFLRWPQNRARLELELEPQPSGIRTR
jgi:hypothetical protein